jgi:hypothetical protein
VALYEQRDSGRVSYFKMKPSHYDNPRYAKRKFRPEITITHLLNAERSVTIQTTDLDGDVTVIALNDEDVDELIMALMVLRKQREKDHDASTRT